MCQHTAAIVHEHLQQVVFLGRKGDELVVDPDLVARQVDLDRSVGRNLTVGLAGRTLTQVCIDARQQNFGTERLGDIVVGAHGQGRHRLLVLGARGEDDDRRVGPLAQRRDDLLTVHVRKAKVEQDQVGLDGNGSAQGLLA